ncbi:MAG: pilus assembly protein PilM [Paludibacteraceae bacterium]|nr:pilus assembly protein PilM [Paludibacteraceae bacterium]
MPKKVKRQLAEVLPLVAIELGSHSVRAMAAEKVGPDLLHVLGYEENRKYACVDRGIVVQTSSAGYMIGETLRLLGNRINHADLPAAFVLLGGSSMQVVPVYSRRDLVRKRTVSDSILEEMEKECKSKIEGRNPGVAVLDLIPSFFVLDGQEQEEAPSPTQRVTLFEAHYIAFVGKKELEEKVIASFDRATKSIEKAFTRPEALLSAFAFEDQSVLTDGCAVLDMGAQTTTLSVYKGNQYLKTKVYPKGGYHITQLIAQQGISFENAEKIKKEHGFAAPALVEKNYTMQIPGSPEINGVWKTSSVELATLIKQALDEMIDPLMDILNEYSGRIRCLYITGGASLLQGIIEYLESKTSVPVLYGSHAGLLDRLTPDEYCSPEYASLVGGLILGSDYRDLHPGKLLEPPTIVAFTKIVDLFTDQQ